MARLEELSIPCRRGPLEDVLARYQELAEERHAVHVVRVSGDCPFVEPDFIDLQLGALRAMDGDVVQVINNAGGAVEGTLGGQQAFSARCLRWVETSAAFRDREHVGSFFLCSEADKLQPIRIEVDPVYERPGLRLQVDEPADLAFARAVWSAADHEGDGSFPLARALRWIEAHPECVSNRHVRESADNQALRRLARSADARPGGAG